MKSIGEQFKDAECILLARRKRKKEKRNQTKNGIKLNRVELATLNYGIKTGSLTETIPEIN